MKKSLVCYRWGRSRPPSRSVRLPPSVAALVLSVRDTSRRDVLLAIFRLSAVREIIAKAPKRVTRPHKKSG